MVQKTDLSMDLVLATSNETSDEYGQHCRTPTQAHISPRHNSSHKKFRFLFGTLGPRSKTLKDSEDVDARSIVRKKSAWNIFASLRGQRPAPTDDSQRSVPAPRPRTTSPSKKNARNGKAENLELECLTLIV